MGRLGQVWCVGIGRDGVGGRVAERVLYEGVGELLQLGQAQA